MPENEERRVGIPESLTINGVTYTVKDTPELQKFIQEVSKVEKSKLYTQFENLKAQIANLGKVKVVENESPSIDAIVEKLRGTFVTKEDLESVLPKVVKEVVQPVLTATEQNRQDELKQYREKLISENIAVCIPDLIKGNTKEELDASLRESIRLRSAYPTPSTSGIDPNKHVTDPLIEKQQREMTNGGSQTPTPQRPPEVPNQIPLTPRRASPEASEGQNVKRMTMEEFAKNRDSLMSQLEATYGVGSL